jgi:hypothetical protein
MVTKKNVVWDSGDLDDALFDSWDEEKETAAIAEAAAAMDVKYIIIEGRIFAGKFPDGTIIKAPLDISLDQIDAISAENDAQVDQVKELFRMIGDEAAAVELEKQNLASTIIYAQKFFAVFQRITEAALGKSGLAN